MKLPRNIDTMATTSDHHRLPLYRALLCHVSYVLKKVVIDASGSAVSHIYSRLGEQRSASLSVTKPIQQSNHEILTLVSTQSLIKICPERVHLVNTYTAAQYSPIAISGIEEIHVVLLVYDPIYIFSCNVRR